MCYTGSDVASCPSWLLEGSCSCDPIFHARSEQERKAQQAHVFKNRRGTCSFAQVVQRWTALPAQSDVVRSMGGRISPWRSWSYSEVLLSTVWWQSAFSVCSWKKNRRTSAVEQQGYFVKRSQGRGGRRSRDEEESQKHFRLEPQPQYLTLRTGPEDSTDCVFSTSHWPPGQKTQWRHNEGYFMTCRHSFGLIQCLMSTICQYSPIWYLPK